MNVLSVTFPSSLIESLQQLLDSGSDADVKFQVGNEQIAAHKLILGMRSPKLKTMLDTLEPGQEPLPIDDCSADDFRYFLNYVYTDECCVTKLNVEKLFKLGTFWDIRTLVEKCLNLMSNQIDETTILRYANYGIFHQDDHALYSKCLSKFPDLLPDLNFMYNENGEWHPTPYQMILHIAKHFERVDEMEDTFVFKCIDWAKKECQVKEIPITPDNLRTVLDEIPYYFHYNQLSPRTLATVIREYEFMNDENLVDCFCEIFNAKCEC